jgi:hypothetical protein
MSVDTIGAKTLALMVRDPKFLQYCIRNEIEPAAFFPDVIDREIAGIVLRLGGEYKGVSSSMIMLEVGKRYKGGDLAQRQAVGERLKAILTEPYTDLDFIAKNTQNEITVRTYEAGLQKAVTLCAGRQGDELVKLFHALEGKTTRNAVVSVGAAEGLDQLEKLFEAERA